MSKIMLLFVSTVEKHLYSNQHKKLSFEIRHIRKKYVYYLFQFFDFGLFTKKKNMTKHCIEQFCWKECLDCNF